MSITALQQEVEALPVEDQDKLAAFLFSLRMRRDGLMEEISRRLDDKNPASWQSWDDVKRASGSSGSPEQGS